MSLLLVKTDVYKEDIKWYAFLLIYFLVFQSGFINRNCKDTNK